MHGLVLKKMILSRLRKLVHIQKKRHSNKIIFVHLTNFIKSGYYFPPDLLDRSKFYTFNKVKEFYFETMEKEQLPFHYYVDRLGNDWEVMLGAPLNYKSDWLQDMINFGYISAEYKEAVVVCIHDNFNRHIPDERMFKVLGQKIVEPYMFINKLTYNLAIHWFDEIFDFSKYNRDASMYGLDLPCKYKVSPMKYFDRISFNLEVLYFT